MGEMITGKAENWRTKVKSRRLVNLKGYRCRPDFYLWRF